MRYIFVAIVLLSFIGIFINLNSNNKKKIVTFNSDNKTELKKLLHTEELDEENEDSKKNELTAGRILISTASKEGEYIGGRGNAITNRNKTKSTPYTPRKLIPLGEFSTNAHKKIDVSDIQDNRPMVNNTKAQQLVGVFTNNNENPTEVHFTVKKEAQEYVKELLRQYDKDDVKYSKVTNMIYSNKDKMKPERIYMEFESSDIPFMTGPSKDIGSSLYESSYNKEQTLDLERKNVVNLMQQKLKKKI